MAFLDILGFGRQTLNKFDETVEAYNEIINTSRWHEQLSPDLTLRIFSDSIILTSAHLGAVINAVNVMQMFALWNNRLVRGGVAHGEHLDVSQAGNTYVVSKALVKAVALEKTIKKPCVAIDPDISIPASWWNIGYPNSQRSILYFDRMTIVSPFNIVWGHSAMTRVAMMCEEHPEHADKYNWFLKLYEAWTQPTPLVPEGA